MRKPASPWSGGTNAENSSPAAKPGRLTTSGSSLTRKSVTIRIRIKHVKNSHFTVVCVTPNSRNAATNSSPVASSISGYIGEIADPHARHFPRSHNHANTGTLSYGLMGVMQRGQRDPGETMEMSSGIRVMQTFRKLPTMIPNRKNKTVMMTTVCPATPRPLFSICHTHPTASINRPSSRASSLTLSSSTSPLFSARSAHRFSLFMRPRVPWSMSGFGSTLCSLCSPCTQRSLRKFFSLQLPRANHFCFWC